MTFLIDISEAKLQKNLILGTFLICGFTNLAKKKLYNALYVSLARNAV